VADFDDAVGAWLAYYEARPEAALERAAHMSEHGTPEGHQGEWLGAALASTPPERRCEHWGDPLTCPDCHRERVAAKREQRRAAREAVENEEGYRADLQAKDQAIGNQSVALDSAWRKIRALEREIERLRRRNDRPRNDRHSQGADQGSRYEPDGEVHAIRVLREMQAELQDPQPGFEELDKAKPRPLNAVRRSKGA
jgi:hypothetical protein